MEFLKEKTDEEIVILARERNPEYFGDLVYRYQQRIFRFIRSIIRNNEVAEDLTQQTFEKAFIALNSFEVKRLFKTWLFTIAKNETFSYLRKFKKMQTISLDQEDPQNHNSLLELADQSPSAAKTLEQSEQQKKVHAALDRLKPKYRAALTLYFFEDQSYLEIAKVLGLRLNTVRTHIRRAKKDLLKILKNETF